MVHEHRLSVRYAETDQMGVVHHASYLVYLEEARTAGVLPRLDEVAAHVASLRR